LEERLGGLETTPNIFNGFGIGQIPLARESFYPVERVLVGQPVADGKREGYHIWACIDRIEERVRPTKGKPDLLTGSDQGATWPGPVALDSCGADAVRPGSSWAEG
jgi:hypothetical protein